MGIGGVVVVVIRMVQTYLDSHLLGGLIEYQRANMILL